MPAVGERDDQAPVAVDALRAPAPLTAAGRAPPRDLAPAQRVARAPGRERRPLELGQPPLERVEQPLERRLDRPRGASSPRVAGPLAQLGRQLLEADGHVQADPEHRPALLRAPLGEDARELREAVRARRARRRSAT